MKVSSVQCTISAISIAALAANVNGFVIPSNALISNKSSSTTNNIQQHHEEKSMKVNPLFMDFSSGIDLSDSLTNAWTSYNIALEEDPLITKSVTAGIILGAADFAGQAFERRNMENENIEEQSVDIARVARFAFFGFILQAPWNHFYYLLLDGALPPTDDPLTATTGIKVAIDQFIQAPIFTVLIFVFLGVLEGKSIESIKGQLDRDYKDTMLANWKLWVPATMVNIAFCPPILRVLFLNCVFFFWSIFLSLKLNNSDDVEEIM